MLPALLLYSLRARKGAWRFTIIYTKTETGGHESSLSREANFIVLRGNLHKGSGHAPALGIFPLQTHQNRLPRSQGLLLRATAGCSEPRKTGCLQSRVWWSAVPNRKGARKLRGRPTVATLWMEYKCLSAGLLFWMLTTQIVILIWKVVEI